MRLSLRVFKQVKEVNYCLLNGILGTGGGAGDDSNNEFQKAIQESLQTSQQVHTGGEPLSAPERKREAGMPVGLTVTLRGENMFNFLEKLIHVSLPRVRDFR